MKFININGKYYNAEIIRMIKKDGHFGITVTFTSGYGEYVCDSGRENVRDNLFDTVIRKLCDPTCAVVELTLDAEKEVVENS